MYDVFYIGKKPADALSHARVVTDRDQAQQQSRTRFYWIIDYLADTQSWDFLWSPPPWQEHQQHIWASASQSHGGIELVPKAGYEDTNYHDEPVVQRRPAPIYCIDHGNPYDGTQYHCERTVRFIGNYLDTVRRVIRTCEEDRIWITSSLCDYTDFDFAWHPDQWNVDLIHVFASNEQRLGDTFYVNVPAARQELFATDLLRLEWSRIKFQSTSVPRWPMPQNVHDHSTHVDAVKAHMFQAPFELFSDGPIDQSLIPTLSVWDLPERHIRPLSPGASAVIVPKDVKRYLRDELYDYPHIHNQHHTLGDEDIPIIFVSNGEPMAEENWKWLEHVVSQHGRRAQRVQGVNGRVASQHAVARAADHPWYFFVPAKLRVSETFDWSWQPDRLQRPKHYIFHAENVLNGLCYGHMATVCYNRDLVLASTGQGLDFTMESPHQVIPEISGSVDLFKSDDETAWRTAFREVIKILHFEQVRPDIENQQRIQAWLGTAGAAGRGAKAGARFFDSVQGALDQLSHSYEWSWCHEQYLRDH